MASDGHRTNILRVGFGRIGVGIAVEGRWGAVVTQLFAPKLRTRPRVYLRNRLSH